jgi:propanol-preferring alcohol dehydrogenase
VERTSTRRTLALRFKQASTTPDVVVTETPYLSEYAGRRRTDPDGLERRRQGVAEREGRRYVRAAVLTKLPSETLEVREVDELVPDAGEIVMRIEACGICGTDLHVMAGTSYRPNLPFILGHEPVGTIVGVGAGVDEAFLAERVVPTIFTGCGRCRFCRSGDERLCREGARITGVTGLPGGFAEQMRLRVEQIVSVPRTLDSRSAASLVDAGTTAHNAVRVFLDDGQPADGADVVVGAGPLGLLVAELLRIKGREVLVVEMNALRKEQVERLGYHCLDAVTEVPGPIASVFDCAGHPSVPNACLGTLEPRGWYLVVGYTVVPHLDMASIARRELTVRGIRSGNRNDLEAMLQLAADEAIRLPEHDEWSLEHINEAFEALRSGKVAGKAVITIGGRS